MESFTNCLNRELGYRAFAPYSGAVFDLLDERWISFPEGVAIQRDTPAGPRRKANPVLDELIAAAEALLNVCRGLDGRANRDLRNYTEAIRKLIAKIEK
jgi:metallo-beta-lactamase family protein